MLPIMARGETKELINSIDFDSITVKQFYELAMKHPKIIRSPIVLTEKFVLIGYSKDEMCLFDRKEDRKARFSKILEAVRMKERYELLDEVGSVAG